MKYHEKMAIASLLTNFSFVTVILLAQQMFGWDRETAKVNVKYAEKNLRISASKMLVEKMADHFLLLTGDREKLVTEEFLAQCAPDHAEAVLAAIKTM